MSEKSKQENQQKVSVHVSPDLDYSYRDVANIYIGVGDVLLEFGNLHRAMPGNATISDRIVLSMHTAIELQQQLQKLIAEAQQKLQLQMQQIQNNQQ